MNVIKIRDLTFSTLQPSTSSQVAHGISGTCVWCGDAKKKKYHVEIKNNCLFCLSNDRAVAGKDGD